MSKSWAGGGDCVGENAAWPMPMLCTMSVKDGCRPLPYLSVLAVSPAGSVVVLVWLSVSLFLLFLPCFIDGP